MYGPRVKHNHSAGFTLMEIMVSILIFGIIITTIFASYRTVFFSTHKIDAGLDTYGMVGSCLNRISLDLSSITIAMSPEYSKPEFDSIPDPYRVVGDRSDVSGGDFSRLRLVSRSHVPLDGSVQESVAEIVYYVSENEDGNYTLHRSDRLYPYTPPSEQAGDPVVCENLKAWVVTYVDKEGTSHDEWDSESEDVDFATPKAINVLLEVGEGETSSMVFETMVMLPVVREAIE